MKKNTLIKIAIIFVAASFLINQAVSAFYKPVTTESAVFYTANNGFKITGVIIRNEILVENSNDGVLHFLIGDGERVAKNGIIANIYGSEAASITLSQMESVQKKIDDINDILSFNDLEAANLELINTRVDEKLDSLVLSASSGNYSNVQGKSEELLFALNRRQAALGDTSTFATQLTALNNELETLKTGLTGIKGEVTAQQSGYFLSKTDGYENVLRVDNLSNISAEFLNGLKADKTAGGVVGKIVSDYEWYIATKVTLNESLKYKVGDALTICTALKSVPELAVTVKQINISKDNNSAVVIYACQQMNSEIAAMRTGNMTVVNSVYKGLKLPRKALRVSDSKTGVYVLSGINLQFVSVNVIYSNDDFIICEQQASNDTVLRLYDEVVVKGRNLYDGKVIG